MQPYIVIGAGILGASTAYHLAKQGASVTLIDRNDAGKATNAAAGIICPWLTNRSNKAWYQLVERGARYYPKLIAELEEAGETNTGYSRVGAINIFDTEEKLNKKMEMALKRKESTPEMGEVTKLSPVQTRELFPPLSEEYGAVHVSGAARVNGASLCDALIRQSQALGVTYIKGDASLLMEGNKAIGVSVNGTNIQSSKVIITSGVWAQNLLKPIGMNFSVTSQKAQIVHLQLQGVDTSKWPVLMPPYSQYMLTFENGKVVVGATQENNIGLDNRVTMGGVRQIIDKALRVAPGLAESRYVETKVGFRPFTPGHLPILGPVPDTGGLFVANGLGASGLTSGPYLGSEVANLVLGLPTAITIDDYNASNAFI